MEDLYGRTHNKSLSSPDGGGSGKYATRSAFGRLTPVPDAVVGAGPIYGTGGGVRLPNGRPAFVPLAGRLTPSDGVSGRASVRQKQQAGPQSSSSASNVLTTSASGNGLLNLSSHNSSKLSSTNSGANSSQTKTTNDSLGHHDLNSTQISPISATRRALMDLSGSSHHQNGGANISRDQLSNPRAGKVSSSRPAPLSQLVVLAAEAGVREMLHSLGLLCLVSLLLALLSLVFLLKISPMPQRASVAAGGANTSDLVLSPGEYSTVYEVTLAMCSLTLCLNLSCLLVCSIQFLFAAKLIRSRDGRVRTAKYLKKAAVTRVCAIAGFFISIPLFLIGIVLFSFIHFNSTPAIVTSVIIGLGIIFCGAAVVHNVYVWQKERTQTRGESGAGSRSNISMAAAGGDTYKAAAGNLSHITLPHATLDLSNGLNATLGARGLELSTLV